jgi:hypothetical protein
VDLTFRVGVVGHRPNRLKHADMQILASRLNAVLDAIRSEVINCHTEHPLLFSDREPVLRGLSPLAEGIDRMFAEQALLLKYELTAVLPFHRSEFVNDFKPSSALEPDSVERFEKLLEQSSNVFELDGTRIDSDHAYATAGDVVLNQSDVLIVVWDGERKNLRGGTEETFDRAIERGVPVVWVDAHQPHHWRIVDKPIRKLEDQKPGERAFLTNSASIDQLKCRVRELIAIPVTNIDTGGNSIVTRSISFYGSDPSSPLID